VTILERYERQATILPLRRAGIPEDLVAAMVDERRTWKQIDQAIRAGGDPTALIGGIAGLEITPPLANEATVTGTATEQAMWPIARTAIPTNPRAPVLYRLFASGTSTTAAAAGTYTLSGRVGTANTAPLIGATSGAVTPVNVGDGSALALFRMLYIRGARHDGDGVQGRWSSTIRARPAAAARSRRPATRSSVASRRRLTSRTANGTVDRGDARDVDHEHVDGAVRRLG
jgi:hypothetical protein